jgi:hypothetical protein
MAAANESQGLKIAVAVFVTLTVVLGVTTYFAYSSYSNALAKQVEAESAKQKYEREWTDAKGQYEFLRDRAGYSKVEDFAALQEAIKKDDARIDAEVKAAGDAVGAMVTAYRNAGGQADKVTELSQAASTLVNQITSEPNKTYVSTLDRMNALVSSMAQLTTSMELDNEALRSSLAAVDETNSKQIQVQIDELKKAKEDLEAEHVKHEQERQRLLTANDELSSKNSAYADQISRLQQDLVAKGDEYTKDVGDLQSKIDNLDARVKLKEDVMDVPDGLVTFVDYGRGEVRTNIGYSQGARARLKLSVFDRDVQGLPNEKPKGQIELIDVGPTSSIGRIVRTDKPSEPIKPQDYLYTPAWSPGAKESFALIGKIDVDGNHVDDRKDLERLIVAAGGKVDYDLPLTDNGQERGQITGKTSWYVVDDRYSDQGADDKAYMTKRSEALRKVRQLGIRPISIQRLLSMLGYKYGEIVEGRTEAVNRSLAEELSKPKPPIQEPGAPPPRPSDGAAPADEPAPAPTGGFGFGPGGF